MKIRRIIPILFFLIAIALSVKSFREPDLWWQIRTGEWILEHGEVPKSDIFSFTQEGNPWINIKWGFEAIAALVARLLGPESVFLIQAVVSCMLVFFLFRLSAHFFDQDPGLSERSHAPRFFLSGTIAFLLTMVGSDYRLVGRPEMMSHLFTILFLLLLERDRINPSNKIYLVIPLQILWANLHEAFGIGLVLVGIYAASEWFDQLLLRKPEAKATRLSLVLIAAAASVAINPNGFQLLLRPIAIFGQVYSNKYTTELLELSAADWWKKEACIALGTAAVSLWAFFRNPTTTKSVLKKLNNPYLISIGAFLFLGLTAYRNLVFLTLVCFPVFHFSLDTLMGRLGKKMKWLKKADAWVAVALLLFFYAGIVSGMYYKITGSRDRFGLEVLSVNNPVGASEFIARHNLTERKCFSDYLTSSYLLWKLQPRFRTYIDLRDLDVFSTDFFNKFIRDVNSPIDFYRLDSLMKFHYVVLFRPQFDALHAYLYNDSLYALKFVDAVAAVYEKTDDFSREDIFTPCHSVKTGVFSLVLNKVLNPFYQPYDYSTVDNDYIAGTYYLNVHRMELVKARADKLLARKKNDRGYELMGQLYYRSSLQEGNDSMKAVLLANAEDAFLQSLAFNKSYAPALIGLGVVHLGQRNFTGALKDLEKCLSIDNTNYQAHLLTAQCYQELLNLNASRKDEYLDKLLRHFQKADALNPGNPQVVANIGFVYFQLNDCERAVHYFSQVEGDAGLGPEDRMAIENCLRQCGY